MPPPQAPLLEALRRHVFAVHATEIFPREGVIACGHFMDEQQQLRWNTRWAPCFRPTIHFALGELVREHEGGYNSWEDMPYAIVLPLGAIEHQLANVFTYDSFAVGDLKLPPGATMIVPKGTDAPPLGNVEIVTYGSGTTLREAVQRVIKDHGGWSFEMQCDAGALNDATALHEGRDVNTPEFFSALLDANPALSFGTHLESERGEAFRFGQIDQLIQEFIDQRHGILPSSPQVRAFGLDLLEHHLCRLDTWIARHGTEAMKPAFEREKTNVRSWMQHVVEKTSCDRARGSVEDPMLGLLCRMPADEVAAFVESERAKQLHVPGDFWLEYGLRRFVTADEAQARREAIPELITRELERLNDFDLFESLRKKLQESTGQKTTDALLLLMREPDIRAHLEARSGHRFPSGGPRTEQDFARAHPRLRRAFEPLPADVALAMTVSGVDLEEPKTVHAAEWRCSNIDEARSQDLPEMSTRPLSDRGKKKVRAGTMRGLYERMCRGDNADALFDRLGLGSQFRAHYPKSSDLFQDQRPLAKVIKALAKEEGGSRPWIGALPWRTAATIALIAVPLIAAPLTNSLGAFVRDAPGAVRAVLLGAASGAGGEEP